MEEAAYYGIVKFLKEQGRSVSPAELAGTLQKSRVTIQSSLKRLLKNGWVAKEGSSPHTKYRAVDLTMGTRETQPLEISEKGVQIDQNSPKSALRAFDSNGILEEFILKSTKTTQKRTSDTIPSKVYSKVMKPLLCFDLDGTLIPRSSWVSLNLRLGISPEDDYRLFTEYVTGNLEYKAWIVKLMELYKAKNTPVTRSDIAALAHTIELSQSAQEIVQNLTVKGYATILISGSVDTIVEVMAGRLGIKEWRASSRAIYNEREELIDIESMGDERAAKLSLLKSFAEQEERVLANVITIGDGGNELELFKVTKGILVGDNTDLAPLAWRTVANLSEIPPLL